MNGLDAILESILSEARGKADVLLSEARERAADIRAQGEREAAALLRQMEEAAAGEADAVRARAESSSAMAGRRILLDARRRTVTGLVDQAMASLSDLPAEDKVVQEAAANLLIEDFAGSSVTETIMLYYQQHNDGKGKHDGSELKQVLIRVLGRRGDVAARPFLMSLLHDPEAAIRKSAMEAIENLMGQLDRRVLVAAIL